MMNELVMSTYYWFRVMELDMYTYFWPNVMVLVTYIYFWSTVIESVMNMCTGLGRWS